MDGVAQADLIVFMDDWYKYDGCISEFLIAIRYDKPVLFMSQSDTSACSAFYRLRQTFQDASPTLDDVEQRHAGNYAYLAGFYSSQLSIVKDFLDLRDQDIQPHSVSS